MWHDMYHLTCKYSTESNGNFIASCQKSPFCLLSTTPLVFTFFISPRAKVYIVVSLFHFLGAFFWPQTRFRSSTLTLSFKSQITINPQVRLSFFLLKYFILCKTEKQNSRHFFKLHQWIVKPDPVSQQGIFKRQK